MKKSIIWTIEKKYLQELVDKSDSLGDILKQLGFTAPGANYKALNMRLFNDNIDLSGLRERAEKKRKVGMIKYIKNKKISLGEVLVENSSYNRCDLKIRLIEEGLLEYKCESCGNVGEWNGKPISLQLEHKNGINNDNRLPNLCFLCPNCHSQTPTFAGRNSKKPKNKCKKCGKDIFKTSTWCYLCCKPKKFEIAKEELEILVQQYPVSEIGKMFSVTDNSIRKRCRRFGISLPYRRGYWQKKAAEISKYKGLPHSSISRISDFHSEEVGA